MLIPEYLRKRLLEAGENQSNDKGLDSEIIVKIFNPYNPESWLITQATEKDGELYLYGYFYSSSEWKWGTVTLRELEETRTERMSYGFPLARDTYLQPHTVSGYLAICGYDSNRSGKLPDEKPRWMSDDIEVLMAFWDD